MSPPQKPFCLASSAETAPLRPRLLLPTPHCHRLVLPRSAAASSLNVGYEIRFPSRAAPSPKRRREGEGMAEMREEAVERLHGVVRDSVGKHLYASAIFLADKVTAATGNPVDVYMLARRSSSAATSVTLVV